MAAGMKIRFDVHPSVRLMEHWMKTLPEKTGRSADQWVGVIRKQKLKDEGAARAWLKSEHELGSNYASWLAERAFTTSKSHPDDGLEGYLALAGQFVEAQYSGKKEALRPIFARLYRLGKSLGEDVKVCPCKTIVPLYRAHVFAEIKPSSNTRVDFGLCLTALMKAGKALPERLKDTGGFAKTDRITHRIALTSAEEVDGFVETWAAKAYELDGPAE